MEDKLIFLSNGRRPQYSCEWKTTSKIKNKQCCLKQIKNDLYAVLKHSTVNTGNLKNIATKIKDKKNK
jgi:hypothetical protein